MVKRAKAGANDGIFPEGLKGCGHVGQPRAHRGVLGADGGLPVDVFLGQVHIGDEHRNGQAHEEEAQVLGAQEAAVLQREGDEHDAAHDKRPPRIRQHQRHKVQGKNEAGHEPDTVARGVKEPMRQERHAEEHERGVVVGVTRHTHQPFEAFVNGKPLGAQDEEGDGNERPDADGEDDNTRHRARESAVVDEGHAQGKNDDGGEELPEIPPGFQGKIGEQACYQGGEQKEPYPAPQVGAEVEAYAFGEHDMEKQDDKQSHPHDLGDGDGRFLADNGPHGIPGHKEEDEIEPHFRLLAKQQKQQHARSWRPGKVVKGCRQQEQ